MFGGAGAVVGASTAKTVTTQTRGLRYLSVHMHTYAGDMDIKVYSPPANAEQFFNICARTSRKEDDVDKILKYKKLLDAGAITLEQFEAKKKELLNI